MKKGFTLIEVLIYSALLSIMMGGILMMTYELLRGAGKLTMKNTAEEEGNFVLRKINLALTGTSIISLPDEFSHYSSIFSITKYNGLQIDLRFHEGKIEMREGGAGMDYLPLTTENVIVSNLGFELIVLDGGFIGIEASTTISGKVFSLKKYLRK